MVNIEYLTNQDGEAIGVVIPIDLWRQLLPPGEVSEKNLAEAVEDYCLNKAMNEAANTSSPLPKTRSAEDTDTFHL